MDMDTWTLTHGHGHMDIDTRTWAHGHGHMDMDTGTWTHGHMYTQLRAYAMAKNNPNKANIIAAHTMQQRGLNALLGHSGLCRHVPWSGKRGFRV